MWIWFCVWFGTGIVAGLIIGNYLDQHDVLYSCTRCRKMQQDIERVTDEQCDQVIQDVLSRVWETGETVIATVDEDGKATITDVTT
jgi:hypothetical protein